LSTVQLKVSEAKQQRDVGRSIARMDSETMKTLGVTVGDVVQIEGKKPTAAKAWPAYPEDQGLGLTPWSPLGGGFLTGKYKRKGGGPKDARRTKEEFNFIQISEETGFRIVDELEKIAKDHDATVAQAALNYLLKKPTVSSVIIGANTSEQLEDNLKAVNWAMTKEEIAKLDKISAPARPYPHWMLDYTRKDRKPN